MDSRLQKISSIITDYSVSNFKKKLKISTRQDEIDAFSSSINMLGEELRSTTIAKNYFTSIFDSISEPIIIVNGKGFIIEMNKSAELLFDHQKKEDHRIHLDQILTIENKNLFSALKKQLQNNQNKSEIQTDILLSNGSKFPAILMMNSFKPGLSQQNGFILSIKDITVQKENKDIIIKTIIDTQEKERLRLAQDIHDSFGQQLSAFKFMIGSHLHLTNDKSISRMLGFMNASVIELQSEIRNVCFNLMPKTLETVNLIAAVQELCAKLKTTYAIKFRIYAQEDFPVLDKSLETSLFRITQEFINNAMQHGKASFIRIDFSSTPNDIYLNLKDNGKGLQFFSKKEPLQSGMGLKNIQSRVEAYNGNLFIKSKNGKGTAFFITIPQKNSQC